jgi:imidazole glycerol-phosphate synthase subunit HisH
MDKKLFVIIDYGMGNLQSVANAFAYLNCNAVISSDKEDVRKADAVILPGVGAFGEAMNNLRELKIIDELNRQVLEKKKPFLGICLGMQLIALDSTENGINNGLGWIPGHVRMIPIPSHLRLPHIGWNDIRVTGKTPLFERIHKDFNFYFVHSYQMECDDCYIVAKCDYGVEVTAAIQHENIFATQFHPEKSQENGLRLLRNFVNYVESYS